jgi:hypothetical protein
LWREKELWFLRERERERERGFERWVGSVIEIKGLGFCDLVLWFGCC